MFQYSNVVVRNLEHFFICLNHLQRMINFTTIYIKRTLKYNKSKLGGNNMVKGGWILVLAIILVLVVRIVVACLFSNKMEEIVNTKEADVTIFGWSMILILFCGLIGMLITVLMVIAIPDCRSNVFDIDNEVNDIKRYIQKI